MNAIEAMKADIIRQYGNWTAYDIKLADGIYTMDERIPNPSLKKIVGMVGDVTQCDLKELRILDLGCLEGQYAIELALQGAKVVGIEGREANIKKAIFSRDVLGLKNLEFYQDDVRNLSIEKYGEFDVVLCSGILYHLDSPDVFCFLENIYQVCKKFVIIDTHIASVPSIMETYKNFNYKGQIFIEHAPTSSLEERLERKWASIDNVKSFWFTEAALYNFLTRIGFSSISKSRNENKPAFTENDRITLLAFKKKPIEIISSPITNQYLEREYSEYQ